VRIVLILVLLSLLAACGGRSDAPADSPTARSGAAATATAPATATVTPASSPTSARQPAIPPYPADLPPPETRVPVYRYEIITTFPHDPEAFTQGLQYVDGLLYEGTGLNGRSSLRRVELETGTVLQQHNLAEEYFGEGIAVVGDRVYQLTWQSLTAFLYNRADFAELERFTYPTEGWGLTFDGSRLVMSDGSATLYFRDPASFDELGRVDVTYLGRPLTQLNELEYIDVAGVGPEVWANVWQTDYIVRIDPATGQVRSLVDLSGLLDGTALSSPVDVLNGIAYDRAGDRLFVTGKLWPTLFQIRLVQAGWAEQR
jgi:glutamine cyclotransferase